MQPIEYRPMEMYETICATIHVGYAGIPFNVNIDVHYERKGNAIKVNDWMEDSSPYDNPPELWYSQVKEAISEHFYESDESITEVTFC